MSRVHEVLHWANRRAVAEEVIRRGYRVSGETLNRWVRDEKEFPAAVERIVFDLFGIGHERESPPAWAEGLVDDAITRVAMLLAAPEVPDALERLSPLLGDTLPPPPAARGAEGSQRGRGTAARPGRRAE